MVDKIKVFASDDNLKSLGELLSNEASRKIMLNLMTREMYTNEIATKLDMRVSLVIYHLKKMEDLGLLKITEKNLIQKGQKHRFFKIDSDIFVTVNKTKEEVKETGLLKRIFRDGIKVAVITFAVLASWKSTTLTVFEDKIEPPTGGSFEIVDMINKTKDVLESTDNIQGDYFIFVPIIIISCSIFLIWFTKKYK